MNYTNLGQTTSGRSRVRRLWNSQVDISIWLPDAFGSMCSIGSDRLRHLGRQANQERQTLVLCFPKGFGYFGEGGGCHGSQEVADWIF
jgi:hypothetical protein